MQLISQKKVSTWRTIGSLKLAWWAILIQNILVTIFALMHLLYPPVAVLWQWWRYKPQRIYRPGWSWVSPSSIINTGCTQAFKWKSILWCKFFFLLLKLVVQCHLQYQKLVLMITQHSPGQEMLFCSGVLSNREGNGL